MLYNWQRYQKEILLKGGISMISLPFITLILLTGYCILDKKAPKQVEGYFPKFAIAFMVTFTILNEAIDLLYTILH